MTSPRATKIVSVGFGLTEAECSNGSLAEGDRLSEEEVLALLPEHERPVDPEIMFNEDNHLLTPIKEFLTPRQKALALLKMYLRSYEKH